MFYYFLLFANIGFGLVSLAHGEYGSGATSLGVAALMAIVGFATRRSAI
jgi:hypothetical protein